MQYLQKTYSMEQILSWRLHWVYCDVSNLIDKIQKDQPSYNGGNTKERIDGYIVSFQDCVTNLRRIVWETSTITGCDYHSDVVKEMKVMEKYVVLMETLDKASVMIKDCMERQLEIDRKTVAGALHFTL